MYHPHRFQFSTAALAAILCGSTLVCCGDARGQVKTVQGLESEVLLPATSGYLLMDESSRDIKAIHLPTLKETLIRPARPADPKVIPTIHALSGPDAKGRIAYIEDFHFVPEEKDQRHLLKTIKLDGSEETELFSRPGDAMWGTTAAGNGEIGSHLALSPVGGRVAFLSELKSVQMPGALLNAGSVEIWDVEQKTGRKMDLAAVDSRLAWFPEGKHLAYVKLAEPDTVDWEGGDDPFGRSFRTWDQIPVVFVRDVEADTEQFLHVGWQPVVSFDGRTVLVSDLEGNWKAVDVASGEASPASWPGSASAGAFAMPAEDVVLSWCRPTEGTEVRHTKSNSPLVGPKPMLSLKLAKLNSQEFQTVVPHIDPRRRVSFGAVRQDDAPAPASRPSLVGEWKAEGVRTQLGPMTITFEFEEDGAVTVAMAHEGEGDLAVRTAGTYRVEGNSLVVTQEHAETEYTFEMDGDDLTLVEAGPGGETFRLKRQPTIQVTTRPTTQSAAKAKGEGEN